MSSYIITLTEKQEKALDELCQRDSRRPPIDKQKWVCERVIGRIDNHISEKYDKAFNRLSVNDKESIIGANKIEV